MKQRIAAAIAEKIEILQMLGGAAYSQQMTRVGQIMADSLKSGGQIMIAGNGGSAADAQHFAGEMVGRFLMERHALPVISLCVDPSVVTCIGNDYGYEDVFSRQVEGFGRPGDVFMGISTSGNSENLIRAVGACKKMGIQTVGLLGKYGGRLADLCDHLILAPSDSTPRIQEIHTFCVHLLCEYLEKELFGEKIHAV